jgi:hypothetical protein
LKAFGARRVVRSLQHPCDALPPRQAEPPPAFAIQEHVPPGHETRHGRRRTFLEITLTCKTLTAVVAALVLSGASASASAAIIVDGNYDSDYGAAKATVTFAPGTPEANFATPTPFTDNVTYSLFSRDVGGSYYGFLKAIGPTGGLSFANLYFDIDPANGNGSDIGVEVTNSRVFVAGGPAGEYAPAPGFSFVVSADGTGIEFKIANSFFMGPVAGLTYFPGQQFAPAGGDVVLRLSQSFGYSVGGGALYGDNRLGRVTLVGAAAVPEPSTVAVLGIGIVGLAFARRRRAASRG